MTGEQIENSFANPVFHAETSSGVVQTSVTSSNPLPVSFPPRVVMVTVVALRPLTPVFGLVCLQESKWSFFKRKLKPSTTFENPAYSEVRGGLKSHRT